MLLRRDIRCTGRLSTRGRANSQSHRNVALPDHRQRALGLDVATSVESDLAPMLPRKDELRRELLEGR